MNGKFLLSPDILILKSNQTIDPTKKSEIIYTKKSIMKVPFNLEPNMFVLASSIEKIKLPSTLVGKLDGRSTLARLGLQVHCSSDIVDGNHEEARAVVFELKNIGVLNIILQPQMAIAMLSFNKLLSAISQKSQSQYAGQTSTVPPNLTNQFK